MKANERPNALRPTRLGCEQLEHRDNPAGNMAAFFSGFGELIILGDSLDNAVSVQQNGFGDVLIFGVNGTTINGLPAIFVGRLTLAGLGIDGGPGNDLIEVLGVQTPSNIAVIGGFGDDGVHVNGVVANVVGIDGRSGNDVVNAFNIVANAVAVEAGIGNDVVATGNVFVSQFAWLNGDAGADVLTNRGIFGPVFHAGFEAFV